MKKLILILNLCLLMLIGCKEDAVTEPTEYEITISGKVVDEAGVALEDCNVILITKNDSVSKLSEIDGTFSFQLKSSGPESVKLIAKKNNFEEQSLYIEDVTQDKVTDLTILLLRSYITISGILTELNEDGVHPSGNAIIRLSTLCASSEFPYLYDTTDQNGNFLFKINYPQSCLERLWIKATKPGYGITEIELDDSITTNISLQISKIVNYFPLKVGNKWEYEVIISGGDGYIYFEYNGKEIWEITYVSSDNINFNLDVYFTGKDIVWDNWHSDKDTVYMTNEKTTYELKFEGGYIKPQNENGIVPWSKSMVSDIIFEHLCSNDGLYIYNRGGDSRISLTYTLSISRGIEYYRDRYSDGSSYSDKKITLLNFIEGG